MPVWRQLDYICTSPHITNGPLESEMWTLFTLTIWCELEWLNLSRTGYGFERKLQQDYCVGIAEPLTKICTLNKFSSCSYVCNWCLVFWRWDLSHVVSWLEAEEFYWSCLYSDILARVCVCAMLLNSWFWGPVITLQDCLAAFFSADDLKGDNMYSCEKCKKSVFCSAFCLFCSQLAACK